jgi:GNAT superfamily N-acetyltransferase
MTAVAPVITIRELSGSLLPDFLAFFDRDAFADNPQWASCYCHFSHAPHDVKRWEERSSEENRAAVCRLIEARYMRGYLAYVDERPVGWCNAGPRTHMTTLGEADQLADRTGSIVCFVVAKPYRRRGVARRLLEAACAGFARQGFELAEGYPRIEAQSEAAHYHGPLSLYLSLGFSKVRAEKGVVVVQKRLA